MLLISPMVTQFEAWTSFVEADREVSSRSGIGSALIRQQAVGAFLRRCAASSARSRSAMMSSMCSIPTLSRIISGLTPALRCSSADICRCVVEAGWQASDLASPILTSRLNNFSAS